MPLLAGEYKRGVIRSRHRPFVELFENLLQRLEGNGATEQIALDKVATKLVQEFELLGGLYTFSDYLQVQGVGHEDNGLDDLHVLTGGRYVLDKGAVYFQGIER